MNQNQFFNVFIVTVILIRAFLWFYPFKSPTVRGFRLHHYMYGFAIIPLGILMHDAFIFAIGLAFFVDEIGFLAIRGKSHEDNYSAASVMILVGAVLGVYFSQSLLLRLL